MSKGTPDDMLGEPVQLMVEAQFRELGLAVQ